MKLNNALEDHRTAWLVAISILPVVAVFLFVSAYPQPAEYHNFADTRTIFGVPNFWNVASNVLFLVYGVAGLRLILMRKSLSILPGLRPAYLVLFFGIALTAFGSGWFHLAPNNDTLYWDRLPMTIAFMPLFTVILGEHVSESLARRICWPLLITGIGSVLYWDYGESLGRGDLRPYGLVQFLPMLLIPIMLYAYRSAYDSTKFYWLAIALYGLAKLLEQLDTHIFALGEFISGHTLKHLAASLVPLVLIRGFKNRRRQGLAIHVESQTTS